MLEHSKMSKCKRSICFYETAAHVEPHDNNHLVVYEAVKFTETVTPDRVTNNKTFLLRCWWEKWAGDRLNREIPHVCEAG